MPGVSGPIGPTGPTGPTDPTDSTPKLGALTKSNYRSVIKDVLIASTIPGGYFLSDIAVIFLDDEAIDAFCERGSIERTGELHDPGIELIIASIDNCEVINRSYMGQLMDGTLVAEVTRGIPLSSGGYDLTVEFEQFYRSMPRVWNVTRSGEAVFRFFGPVLNFFEARDLLFTYNFNGEGEKSTVLYNYKVGKATPSGPGVSDYIIEGKLGIPTLKGDLVEVKTIDPLDTDFIPLTAGSQWIGQVQILGAEGSNILITGLDHNDVHVQLDVDGDGNDEVEEFLAWSAILPAAP